MGVGNNLVLRTEVQLIFRGFFFFVFFPLFFTHDKYTFEWENRNISFITDHQVNFPFWKKNMKLDVIFLMAIALIVASQVVCDAVPLPAAEEDIQIIGRELRTLVPRGGRCTGRGSGRCIKGRVSRTCSYDKKDRCTRRLEYDCPADGKW